MKLAEGTTTDAGGDPESSSSSSRSPGEADPGRPEGPPAAPVAPGRPGEPAEVPGRPGELAEVLADPAIDARNRERLSRALRGHPAARSVEAIRSLIAKSRRETVRNPVGFVLKALRNMAQERGPGDDGPPAPMEPTRPPAAAPGPPPDPDEAGAAAEAARRAAAEREDRRWAREAQDRARWEGLSGPERAAVEAADVREAPGLPPRARNLSCIRRLATLSADGLAELVAGDGRSP